MIWKSAFALNENDGDPLDLHFIEHPEDEVITQSQLSENEIGPQSSFQQMLIKHARCRNTKDTN